VTNLHKPWQWVSSTDAGLCTLRKGIGRPMWMPNSQTSIPTSCTCPYRSPETSLFGWGWSGPTGIAHGAGRTQAKCTIRASSSCKTLCPKTSKKTVTSVVPLSLMPYLSLVFLILSETPLMNFFISWKITEQTLVAYFSIIWVICPFINFGRIWWICTM
jgi:hypothetical protein